MAVYTYPDTAPGVLSGEATAFQRKCLLAAGRRPYT